MLNNKKNLILMLKNYPENFKSPVLNLKDIYEPFIEEHYINNIYKIKNFILDDKSIISPVTTANILSYKNDYNLLKALNLPFTAKMRFFLRDLSKAEQYVKSVFSPFEKISILSSQDQKLFEINSLQDLRSKWTEFFEKNRSIYIEKVFYGDLLKIFIKDEKIISIHGVMPAHIIGDGKKTVGELVDKFNEYRSTNILYKNNIFKKNQLLIREDYQPVKGEFVKLNNSLDVSMGAVYVDLSFPLKDKFNALAYMLKNILLKVNYLEVTCCSDDFLLGMASTNFYIREIKQNSADLQDLYSCCTTISDVNHISDIVFSGSNDSEKGKLVLKKADVFDSSNLNNATQSAIIKHAANRLGLKYKLLSPFLYSIADITAKNEVIFNFGMSQYTSFLARTISNDKFITKELLNKYGINTPQGIALSIKDKEKALALINSSIPERVWVIKPLSGSGGVGVSTGIESRQDFEVAWSICERMRANVILLEEQVSGNDYRIVVVQDSICAVTQRIAAYVIGDGEQTIRNLIKIKAEERKKNPFYRLKVFAPNEIMVEFLRKKGLTLDSIPDRLERIELLEAVNIGSGGESIDRTDEVHPDWNDVAIKTRKAILNAYHVGLDLMAEDISKSPKEQKWSIIEVNTNPDLGLQLFPEIGSPRDIGASLLLSIFGDLSHLKKRAYTLTILGKVQKVGFRKWFKSICDVRSVTGYVRNSSEENVVEALICGHEATLDEVIELAYKGPKNAEIETIIFGDISDNLEKTYETFTIQ